MMPAGQRDKRVTLDAPGTPVADADGGFLDGYTPLNPPDVYAAIVPVSARDQERAFAGTVLATATHDDHAAVSPRRDHRDAGAATSIARRGRTRDVPGERPCATRTRPGASWC